MKYKLGIIGYPLGHSISAVIQKAGFESIGLDVEYDVLETSPENLVDRIKYLKVNGYDLPKMRSTRSYTTSTTP